MTDLESRTRNALRQFDQNMAGIFDRAAFYDGDIYSTTSSSPELSRTQAFFKWTLLISNVIFAVFGVALLSVGAYALNNQVAVLSGVTLPAGLIVMGVFILLVSILGGISAWRENRGCLGFYFVFMLIFTIILFAVGIAVDVEKNNSQDLIQSGFENANPDLRRSFQAAFVCCGLSDATSPDPYAEYPCPALANITGKCIGCLNVLNSDFQSALNTAGGVGIAFAVIMIAFLIGICLLMNGIKRKKFEYERAQLRGGTPGDSTVPVGTVEEGGLIDATNAPRKETTEETA